MPDVIALSCSCGHTWLARVVWLDLEQFVQRTRCPGCRVLGTERARAGWVIRNPLTDLLWSTAPDRPVHVVNWSCTTLKNAPGQVCVSFLCDTRVPAGGRNEGDRCYEIIRTEAGSYVGAMMFDRNIGGDITQQEIPPHLLDLSRTIALDMRAVPRFLLHGRAVPCGDGRPLKDWQGWVRTALARQQQTNDGEDA